MGDWRSFRTAIDITGGVTSAKIYLIEDTPAIAFEDYDFGDEGMFIYHIEKVCVYKETDTGEVFAPGDRVYWSGTDGDPVTAEYASGYYWVGICIEPAAQADEFVLIDFKGDKATIGTMPT
jgi:hypothetical protein